MAAFSLPTQVNRLSQDNYSTVQDPWNRCVIGQFAYPHHSEIKAAIRHTVYQTRSWTSIELRVQFSVKLNDGSTKQIECSTEPAKDIDDVLHELTVTINTVINNSGASMECDEFAVVYVRAFESGPFIAL